MQPQAINGLENYNMSGNWGISSSNGHNKSNRSNQQSCENGMATNLTESNEGIARQSNLVDEIIFLKQQHTPDDTGRNFFKSNSGIGKNNNSGFVLDDLLVDLSRRVNNLTVTEMQEAQNDMYGFRLQREREDPFEINTLMNEMNKMIQKGISGNDSRFSALRLAMRFNGNRSSISSNHPNACIGGGSNMNGADYVLSQRVKFLRASDWSVMAAVFRMALFFELKLEYFGSECLTRDLTMKDLTKIDRDLWRRYGFLQLAEERDVSGRAIMIIVGKEQFHLPIATVMRCIMYLSTVMVRDDSIQLSGSAQLMWGVGQELVAYQRFRHLIKAYKAIPLRGVARHICYNTLGLTKMFSYIAKTTQTWGVVRMKLHKGSSMECVYNLMTYGIPRNAIPINNEGEVELEFHRNFLVAIERTEADDEKRRRQERLDEQMQQLQLQRQMPMNNAMGKSWLGQGIPNRRDEPYQREPHVMPTDLAINNNIISNNNTTTTNDDNYNNNELPSWNTFGIPEIDSLSLQSENMEGLGDDFVSRLTEIRSNVSRKTDSRIAGTTSPALNPALKHTQPSAVASTMPLKSSENSHKSNETLQTFPRQTDEFIIVPGVLDVIMGRGRHNKKKPGNRKLNNLLASYQNEYEASDKFQKTILSEVVVAKMIEDGSRFLVREGEKEHGMWVEVSHEKARDKVAHDFRNLRRSAKMAEKKSTTTASDDSVTVRSIESGQPKRQRSLMNAFDEENDSKLKKPSMMGI